MDEAARRAERLVNTIRALVAAAWALVNALFQAQGDAWMPVGVLAVTVLFSQLALQRGAGLLWVAYAAMGADVAAVVLAGLGDHEMAPLVPGALGLVILATAFRMSVGLTAAASAVALVVWLGFGGVSGAIRGAPTVVSNLVGLGVVGTTVLLLVQEARDRITAAGQAEARRARGLEALSLHLTADYAARLEAAGSGPLVPARREVTVVLARLGGLEALGRGTPEAAVSAMTEYMEECARVALRGDAVVDRVFGAELRAVFNAPLSQSDHARRAVLLARELHLVVALLNQERAARGAPSLYLSVVVHTGEAVTGRAARPGRVQYLVAGEPLSLAAALLEQAAPGETLATAEAISRAGLPEPLEPLEIPGRPGTVSAARIRTLGALLPDARRLLTDETGEG